jgi:hypothetical protein
MSARGCFCGARGAHRARFAPSARRSVRGVALFPDAPRFSARGWSARRWRSGPAVANCVPRGPCGASEGSCGAPKRGLVLRLPIGERRNKTPWQRARSRTTKGVSVTGQRENRDVRSHRRVRSTGRVGSGLPVDPVTRRSPGKGGDVLPYRCTTTVIQDGAPNPRRFARRRPAQRSHHDRYPGHRPDSAPPWPFRNLGALARSGAQAGIRLSSSPDRPAAAA